MGERTKRIHAATENHKQQSQSAVEGVGGTIQGALSRHFVGGCLDNHSTIQ